MKKRKINDNRKETKEDNWNEILYGKKFLNKNNETKIKKAMKDFRKE